MSNTEPKQPRFLYRKHEYNPEGELVHTKYVLVDLPFLHVRLTKIVRGEPDAPHDHSAGYISIVLRGGYDERVWFGRLAKHGESAPRFAYATRPPDATTQRRAGSVVARYASTVHTVRRVLPNTWTLLVSAPASRAGRVCPHPDQVMVERFHRAPLFDGDDVGSDHP